MQYKTTLLIGLAILAQVCSARERGGHQRSWWNTITDHVSSFLGGDDSSTSHNPPAGDHCSCVWVRREKTFQDDYLSDSDCAGNEISRNPGDCVCYNGYSVLDGSCVDNSDCPTQETQTCISDVEHYLGANEQSTEWKCPNWASYQVEGPGCFCNSEKASRSEKTGGCVLDSKCGEDHAEGEEEIPSCTNNEVYIPANEQYREFSCPSRTERVISGPGCFCDYSNSHRNDVTGQCTLDDPDTTCPAAEILQTTTVSSSGEGEYEGGSTGGEQTECGVRKTRAGRIVNGQNAGVGQFPWQVSIVGPGSSWQSHYCGGSVYRNKIVITAAHCITENDIDQHRVVAGSHTIYTEESGEQHVNVKKIVVHPDYDSNLMPNDIALMLLETPLEYNSVVQPVCLPSYKVEAGTTCTVSGWGALSEGGSAPNTLQYVKVDIVTDDTCKSAYGTFFGDVMVCAQQDGKDSCQGDSGGPFVCENQAGQMELHGVVSFGIGCAREQYPGVYTEVFNSDLTAWIKDCSDSLEQGSTDGCGSRVTQ